MTPFNLNLETNSNTYCTINESYGKGAGAPTI